MATGDGADMARRLRVVLPRRWFSDTSPVLDAVLEGFGSGWAALHDQVNYGLNQLRLLTVTGVWLDLASLDYKGGALPRRFNESDDAFRNRLLPILPDRGTRPALEARLAQLTGQPFWVFEAMRPVDVGGYGVARSYGQTVLGVPRYIGEGAFGSSQEMVLADGQGDVILANGAPILLSSNGVTGAGRYGSLSLPFQVFIRISRPTNGMLDVDLYAAIARMLPIAVTAWVCLEPDPGSSPSRTAPLDAFVLDSNVLA